MFRLRFAYFAKGVSEGVVERILVMDEEVYVIISDGFEQMEALAPVDFLRRAKIGTRTVGITKKIVRSSHDVEVVMDVVLDEVYESEPKMIVLPGGPGASAMSQSTHLREMLQRQHQRNSYIAAICAAPVVVLDRFGLLRDRKFTCYKDMENELEDSSATYVDAPLVRSGNIITARAVGSAAIFSIALVMLLRKSSNAQHVWETTMQTECSKIRFQELETMLADTELRS